jgi:putative flavoprotein involved in K+ transport
MPPQPGETYPDAAHVASYLTDYEQRYALPVLRPVRIEGVHRDGEFLRVEADAGVRGLAGQPPAQGAGPVATEIMPL